LTGYLYSALYYSDIYLEVGMWLRRVFPGSRGIYSLGTQTHKSDMVSDSPKPIA